MEGRFGNSESFLGPSELNVPTYTLLSQESTGKIKNENKNENE